MPTAATPPGESVPCPHGSTDPDWCFHCPTQQPAPPPMPGRYPTRMHGPRLGRSTRRTDPNPVGVGPGLTATLVGTPDPPKPGCGGSLRVANGVYFECHLDDRHRGDHEHRGRNFRITWTGQARQIRAVSSQRTRP